MLQSSERMAQPAPRESCIRQFGDDPIAYATLQPGLRYLDTSFGYIAYRRVFGTDISLGPPVCAQADRAELIGRFLAQSRRPLLCYIRGDIAEILDTTPLYCAGMGSDREVDHAALAQHPPSPLQGALKKSRAVGFNVEPVDMSQLDAQTHRRLQAISERYLQHARCRNEISFINRPMSFSEDGMRRNFLLQKFDGEHAGVFGYAVLNPIFESGTVVGYLLDTLRFEPTRLWGVWLSTVSALSQRLAREGKRLSLGFCPLYGVHAAPRRASPWLDLQMRCLARSFAAAPYLRRLRELKSSIPGYDEPRYFASHSRNAVSALLALLRASDVPLNSLLGLTAARAIRSGWTPTSTPWREARP